MPFWQSLLAFSDIQLLPIWRRTSGWQGRPCAGIRNLVYLHQLAFTAEINGAHKRADYFWSELHVCLRHAWTRLADWNAAAGLIGKSVARDGENLRQVIAEELVLDSHMAFANGDTSDSTGPGPRALAHLSWIRALLELETPPLAPAATVLLPLVELRTTQLEKREQYAEAISWLKNQPECLDETLASRISGLIFESTLAKLEPDGERNALKNADLLAKGIIELQRILLKAPDTLVVHDYLSELHFLRCVRLANGKDTAEALVVCAKAMAHNPSNARAEQAMVQLTKNMRSIQEDSNHLQEELGKTVGIELSPEGVALQRQAKAGFKAVERYQTSGEPERLAKARHLAIAASVWRSVRPDPNTARPGNEQILQLLEVVSALFDSGKEDEGALLKLFEELAEKSPGLPPVEANALVRFVVRRRHEPDEACAKAEPEAIVDPETIEQHAIPAAAAANQDRPPFLHWLMGKQDLGTRIFAAAAVACTIGVAVLSAEEMSKRETRNQAVLAVRQAGAGNAETVITAAERFLRTEGLGTEDPRRGEIVDAYARAISSWFLGVDQPAQESVRERVNAYRLLTDRRGVQ